MGARRQGGVLLGLAVLEAQLLTLLFALLFALELVGDAALVLWSGVLVVMFGGLTGIECRRTRVKSLVRVLLALVEAGLLLSLLELRVFVVALVASLVDLAVSDVGLRHCGDVFWGVGWRVVWVV